MSLIYVYANVFAFVHLCVIVSEYLKEKLSFGLIYSLLYLIWAGNYLSDLFLLMKCKHFGFKYLNFYFESIQSCVQNIFDVYKKDCNQLTALEMNEHK